MIDVYDLLQLIASFLAVVVVLTLHEFSHAYVACKCGDPTPKWNRRLSLNPLRHFDPLGLVCFAFVGFGWAKPVAINPNNFKSFRKGLFLTSSAGIITNYICAWLFFPLYFAVACYGQELPPLLYYFLSMLTYFFFAYSLSFCVFNLLPLYPLDGFRIVDALNRRRGRVYRFLREYGYWILLGLIAESFICRIFYQNLGIYQMEYYDILGWFMKFATEIFGWPIRKLWGLVPW